MSVESGRVWGSLRVYLSNVKCFVLCETERVVWHFLIFRERLALDMGDAS